MNPSRSKPVGGYSLLELLVVVCVGAMLTVLATSGYAAVLRRANRHEIRLALWRLATAQENHRLQFGRYATLVDLRPGATATADILPAASAPEGWQLSFASVNDDGWVVVAVRTQPDRDAQCTEWRLDATGGVSARSMDGRDTTAECWRR